MGKPKLFTQEQEQYILDMYKYKSNADIAKILNCKPTQINSWLNHRCIKRGEEFRFNKNKIFSEKDIEFIKK